MGKIVSELCYSSDTKWLRRACALVFSIPKGKLDLVRPCLLTNLSLSLARAKMPADACMILRVMLERERLPEVNMLGLIILHMVNTDFGMYLASNILFEICECTGTSSGENRIKLDTVTFNLVLDACVRFGSFLKGQQIIELMAKVGVVADAHTISVIAQIHEMNYQRDELKKFKDHVEKVSYHFVRHFRQFFDSLLNLHLKFNDIDSACGLIMDIYKYQESISCQDDTTKPQNPCLVPIGSQNLKSGLKLQILPQVLPKDQIVKVECKQELILYQKGKLVLSNKALAKIINGYKRSGRISDLSKLLSSIQKNVASLQGENLCSGVVDACIHVGWLETAHDIMEDLDSMGVPLGMSSYVSLLKAYYKQQMFREAEALIKQSQKAGVFGNMSNEMVYSTFLFPHEKKTSYSEAVSTCGKSDLADSLAREMSKEQEDTSFVVNELNSSIYFFMKANMIDDAMKAYRKMQEMRIHPTQLTFFALISGYSSLNMYREITIIWGDIKRNMDSCSLATDRDLYELLLYNFIRGGYFERVMEIISHMKDHGMFVDKWMYKREFLKYHKDLYRNLKDSNAKNEVQSDRIEYVQAFRKWVGIR
ncbi:Pentatricopeptide repeat-containing protein [Heracleum sosnowskyi]|uniref:Pentatricopeptide repeat-containing protein n=1 Tax=Heracleum sosnowskyi TaxID=360622 RepID=A0AAD8JHU9_9APIA|nr:Pentatricopeptide repeat-containing protein [Heracleum sosnowskyi]